MWKHAKWLSSKRLFSQQDEFCRVFPEPHLFPGIVLFYFQNDLRSCQDWESANVSMKDTFEELLNLICSCCPRRGMHEVRGWRMESQSGHQAPQKGTSSRLATKRRKAPLNLKPMDGSSQITTAKCSSESGQVCQSAYYSNLQRSAYCQFFSQFFLLVGNPWMDATIQ